MRSEGIWDTLEERGIYPTEQEKMVLTLHYGPDGEEPRTLEQVAEILGVTRERVRQIEIRMLRRHVNHRRSKKIKDFYV